MIEKKSKKNKKEIEELSEKAWQYVASEDKRQERRKIKQELWQIRLFVEKEKNADGSKRELTEEQKQLKKAYEKLPNFTSWNGFPEKWDIGDPYEVKKTAHSFNDVDKFNFERAFGKSYETIINKEIEKA